MRALVRLAALACLAVSGVAAAVLLVRALNVHGGLDQARLANALAVPFVFGLTTLLGAIVLVFRPERLTVAGLRWTFHALALALVLGIAGVWYLNGMNVNTDPGIGKAVSTQAEVGALLEPHLTAAEAAGGTTYLVPTGVYIESLEFLSANNVQVTGYVWQTYDASIPAEVTRGFVLPEAIEEAYEAEEAYRRAGDEGETIGWYFHAVLRQQFDYRQYPFDHQDVWLRLWHADLDRAIVLVPDFSAYADIDPLTLPGLDNQFVYEGWHPEYTGFSVDFHAFNTSFGLDRPVTPDSVPELFYNVGVRRNVVAPLLDHILALAVVAILLYATARLTTMDEEHQRRRGNSVFDVLGYCAALMFIVILAHNGIRGSVSPDQIAYLEMFPFLLYTAILLVAMNAILLASATPPRLLAYQDNIVARLLYWPLLLGALLVMTLLTLVW